VHGLMCREMSRISGVHKLFYLNRRGPPQSMFQLLPSRNTRTSARVELIRVAVRRISKNA
jgi:hypothetical protein